MVYSNSDVCAIIVTYNPDYRLSLNCDRLLQQQVDSILIVDNGSDNGILDNIAASGSHKITVLYNKTNIGLAAALNVGLLYIKKHYQLVLTFDQDSIITDSYICNLIETFNAYPHNDTVAIVSPIYKDQTTGVLESYHDRGKGENKLYAYATTTMTSGNLINAITFDTVGLFRADFFIDYIDNEFCLRCQQHGFKIIESRKACLLHNAGEPRQYRLLWGNVHPSNHSPLRRYYSTRNRIIVYKLYFAKYPGWVLRNIYVLIKDVIKISLYEKKRIKKYCWMLKGIRDAILNKMGQVTEETPNVHFKD